LAQAEEGLLHMMGVLRERDEVKSSTKPPAAQGFFPVCVGWGRQRAARSNVWKPKVDRRSGSGWSSWDFPAEQMTGGLAKA